MPKEKRDRTSIHQTWTCLLYFFLFLFYKYLILMKTHTAILGSNGKFAINLDGFIQILTIQLELWMLFSVAHIFFSIQVKESVENRSDRENERKKNRIQALPVCHWSRVGFVSLTVEIYLSQIILIIKESISVEKATHNLCLLFHAAP